MCLDEDVDEKKVLVLSYPQYCRYRSIIARLRERPTSFLTDHVVLALGGIASLTNNTQILYCRDTFEHPTLVENESVCDEFGKSILQKPQSETNTTQVQCKHVLSDRNGPILHFYIVHYIELCLALQN